MQKVVHEVSMEELVHIINGMKEEFIVRVALEGEEESDGAGFIQT